MRHDHIPNTGETAIKEGTSRRYPLANCPEESRHSNPGEAEQIGPDTASSSADEIPRSLTQQGAKSARSPLDTLLALLALTYTRNLLELKPGEASWIKEDIGQ